MRETYKVREIETTLKVVEGNVHSIRQKDITKTGCRIYKDGYMGVAGTLGEPNEDTWKAAEDNLKLKVAYPYAPEKNTVKTIDYRKPGMATPELLRQVEDILDYLNKNHSDYSFDGFIFDTENEYSLENEEGLNLNSKDRAYSFQLLIKDKKLTNVFDLALGISEREFNRDKIIRITEQMLKAFHNEVEMPTEAYVVIHPMTLLSQLENDLNGEKIGTKTSLLSGKEGKKVFSDKVTIYTSQEREGMYIGQPFFDAEGRFKEEPCLWIDKGVFVKPYADKRVADKYGLESTGSAEGAYDDIPTIMSMELLEFKDSGKTLKELLDGTPGVLIDMASGGDFTSTGDYASPVQLAYLTDGENIIGKLPECNISGNIFDFLGDGYVGYSKDDDLTGDKMLVLKMKIS